MSARTKAAQLLAELLTAKTGTYVDMTDALSVVDAIADCATTEPNRKIRRAVQTNC